MASPWHAELTSAGEASLDSVAAAADGRVAVTFGAAGAASLGGAELTPPTGGGGVALVAPGGAPAWSRVVSVRPGAVALTADAVIAAVGGHGEVDLGGDAPVALRGEPGAALWALARADGGTRWTAPLGSTDWVVVRALAALPDGGVVAGGSFAGTLRAGARVVTAAGAADGFVVRLGPDGAVAWLVRLGGIRGDAVTGVAPAGDGLAIAGTFTGDAELRGVALAPADDRSIAPDGFVARLHGDGAVAWARSFGGAREDAVAGVAVTDGGTIAVAATLRGDAVVEDRLVATRGLADAALITWDGAGSRRGVALIGGPDLDTATAIAAIGEDLVVAATYAGGVTLGGDRLEARGGDGALIAVLDASGEPVRTRDVPGMGRETVSALAGTPAGWAAVVRHTAGAQLDDIVLSAPADPYGGAALFFRGE